MAVLGSGKAHGACSLLHAAGLGYGASMALDIPVAVRLLDKPSKRGIDDPDNLLSETLKVWQEKGHSLPAAEDELHWATLSKIPPRQGLKSSAAISIAALRALADATEIEVSDFDFVEMSAQAQINAGVSLTGSIDDAWACLKPGWKLIDPQAETIEQGVLFEGDGPSSDDWMVMIACRGERQKRPELEDFVPHGASFQKALQALQEFNELVALTWNGRATVAVLKDIKGRKITNDAILNGARSAGITGSGNAIVIVAPKVSKPTCDRLRRYLENSNEVDKVIETSFLNSEITEEE